YIGYRCFWALWHVTWTILSGVLVYPWYSKEANRVTWFIYLTNWSYLLLTLTSLVQVPCCIYYMTKIEGMSERCQLHVGALRRPVGLLWCLYNISTSVAILVTLGYWLLIYSGGIVYPVDAATHAVNSVYVIIDLLFTAIPVRLLHFIYPLIYVIIYALFSAIYQAAGGTNAYDLEYIYSVLDWRNPGRAILVVFILGIIVLPLLHTGVFGLYKLRVFTFNKYFPGNNDDIDGAEKYSVNQQQLDQNNKSGTNEMSNPVYLISLTETGTGDKPTTISA
ncbi:unnamed protein product, partial [Owenia fusiformis]